MFFLSWERFRFDRKTAGTAVERTHTHNIGREKHMK